MIVAQNHQLRPTHLIWSIRRHNLNETITLCRRSFSCIWSMIIEWHIYLASERIAHNVTIMWRTKERTIYNFVHLFVTIYLKTLYRPIHVQLTANNSYTWLIHFSHGQKVVRNWRHQFFAFFSFKFKKGMRIYRRPLLPVLTLFSMGKANTK